MVAVAMMVRTPDGKVGMVGDTMDADVKVLFADGSHAYHNETAVTVLPDAVDYEGFIAGWLDAQTAKCWTCGASLGEGATMPFYCGSHDPENGEDR
jgi:hypothetical protein